jgi:hypothetical protein
VFNVYGAAHVIITPLSFFVELITNLANLRGISEKTAEQFGAASWTHCAFVVCFFT